MEVTGIHQSEMSHGRRNDPFGLGPRAKLRISAPGIDSDITFGDLDREVWRERQGKEVTPTAPRSKFPNQGTSLLELLQLHQCQGHCQ